MENAQAGTERAQRLGWGWGGPQGDLEAVLGVGERKMGHRRGDEAPRGLLRAQGLQPETVQCGSLPVPTPALEKAAGFLVMRCSPGNFLSRNSCLLTFLNRINQGSDQTASAREAAGTQTCLSSREA